MIASCRFYVVTIICAASLVACGGSQSPIGAPGAMPAPALQRAAGHSRDLLYITGAMTDIYTYPKSHFVSSLDVTGGTLCSNEGGDVFITTAYSIAGVAEYPHGGARRVAFIDSPFGFPYSCSVDPTTGNLAVVAESSSLRGVAVYRAQKHHRWHIPHIYYFSQPQQACSYDTNGNLFVGGFTSGSGFALMELSKGSASFQTISLDTKVLRQGDLQWDGQYLAIGDGPDNTTIHRFAIQGTSGKQISSLTLSNVHSIRQFWIQGSRLIAPDFLGKDVGFWRYPEGGKPVKRLKLTGTSGVTVSLAPR